MAMPKSINPADYKDNIELNAALKQGLTMLGLDAEDQAIYLAFMFASDNPDEATVQSLAQTYHGTPEMVRNHAATLYQKVNPIIRSLLGK
jgi:predicted short-subunit dehydrogenase-like oxidoreductase (DUF2520 family)